MTFSNIRIKIFIRLQTVENILTQVYEPKSHTNDLF